MTWSWLLMLVATKVKASGLIGTLWAIYGDKWRRKK